MPNILIGGVTNSGKSILARALAEKHDYSRIPGDPLVVAFQKEFPALGIAPGRDGFVEACHVFGRFVTAMVNALVWEGSVRYVIDSSYFRPRDVQGVDQNKTRILFFGYPGTDVEAKLQQTLQYQARHGGGLQQEPLSEEQVREQLRTYVEMSKQDREDCAKLGYTYIDTSYDFRSTLEAATRDVLGE